jgi:hypothetical protein
MLIICEIRLWLFNIYRMKICSKCHLEKELKEYPIRKVSIDGYRHTCKVCTKSYRKPIANYIVPITKICVECNKEKDILEFNKRKDTPDGYRNNCKSCLTIYRENNRDRANLHNKNYRIYQKDKINEYSRKRWTTDILYKLRHSLGNNIRSAFKRKGYNKNSTTEMLLGITYTEFKIYIENKFDNWMTYDNHGLYNGEYNFGWDIDHIKPTSLAKNEKELIELCHYTNLQPLCSKINRDIKKDNYQSS